MRIWILIILFSVISTSCNSKASAERKIKKTVTSFLDAVEQKDGSKYQSLIYESESYPGVISMEKSFFYKNYKKINSNIDLKESIKIKDTIFNRAKRKYVQYHIKNNNPDYFQKPLIITFIFYDQIGYDKIYNHSIFDNMLDWE
ncbi:hypothetical protein [Chryseobacterium sp. KMC2]|uniref:hypothetical protein n=1 Tax=Chryseobacterium sp. KMC2 TaxID=2800705 RepID=UPI001924A6EE|nr:hypothetical protein [Chryseobacterium sp. KMC2]MBL3550533.1 hypothetical protein [Chryseobacterium sp. KMC2]